MRDRAFVARAPRKAEPQWPLIFIVAGSAVWATFLAFVAVWAVRWVL